MKIEYININNIKPYKNNPRKNDNAIDKVMASIKEFGFKNPIIVDKNMEIITGHTRLKAAKKLKIKEVPIIRAEDLSEEQVKAFRIADNKAGEIAEWDIDLLLKEINQLELNNYNVELTGFEINELNELKPLNNEGIIEDDFDEAPPENPVSKRGDIWTLGRHRLMCGDSVTNDVDELMDGNKADMVFTDPPYGISYSGGRTGGDAKPSHGQIKNDDLRKEELGNLITKSFTNNKAEADVYICVSPIMQKPFLDVLSNWDKRVDAVIVWDKKNAGLGYMAYRRQCEFIYFIKGGAFHKGDKSDFDLWSISKLNTAEYLHGTQKPIGVPARAIENSSKQEDIVLDIFGGSGSTLIASEQLNRICYMMELDEKYVDVIVKRYINYKESDDDVYLIRNGNKIPYKEVIICQQEENAN